MARLVECIETGEIWNSLKECSNDVDIPFRYLSRIILEGRTHQEKEFTFRYLPPKKPPRIRKKIPKENAATNTALCKTTSQDID